MLFFSRKKVPKFTTSSSAPSARLQPRFAHSCAAVIMRESDTELAVNCAEIMRASLLGGSLKESLDGRRPIGGRQARQHARTRDTGTEGTPRAFQSPVLRPWTPPTPHTPLLVVLTPARPHTLLSPGPSPGLTRSARQGAAETESAALTVADPLQRSKAGQRRTRRWHELPEQTLTPQLKRELRLLKLRGAADPKRFYKRNDTTQLPTRFEVGTVVEGAADFFSARLAKRERKQTLAEELMADRRLRAYRKKRVLKQAPGGPSRAPARRARPQK